jgi:hypothetical protein
MRRKFAGFMVIMLCLSLACQTVTGSVRLAAPPTGSPLPDTTRTSTSAPQPQIPTDIPTLPSSITPSPNYIPRPWIPVEPLTEFNVILHPDGELYIGDRISLEILVPHHFDTHNQQVLVYVDNKEKPVSNPVKFQPFGLANRSQATLYWAWDTRDLEPGNHTLQISIEPSHITWQEQVSLLPQQESPAIEKEAQWKTTESDCCNIYYISHTAAERDLDQLIAMVDEQADSASQALDYSLDEPISVDFIPRILGHGGFTDQEVNISYLDRDYIGASEEIVLHHEFVHLIDGRLGGENRPSLFVEGLAVYLSGGHFHPEDLMPRATSLLELDWYIPMQKLLEDFYLAQHEISYLEAGALVQFMVDTWGWRGFADFYRNIPTPSRDQNQQDMVNRALSDQFGITFDLLEARFLDRLRAQRVSTHQVAEVRYSVEVFETIRRYQQAYDPSAYFLSAWMVDGESLRNKSIIADYLRHPSQDENIVFETMLNAAASFLETGDYQEMNRILTAIQTVMDGIDQNVSNPYQLDPLAADYLAIIRSLGEQGFQLQKIIVIGETARVWTTGEFIDLQEMALLREGDGWIISKAIE